MRPVPDSYKNSNKIFSSNRSHYTYETIRKKEKKTHPGLLQSGQGQVTVRLGKYFHYQSYSTLTFSRRLLTMKGSPTSLSPCKALSTEVQILSRTSSTEPTTILTIPRHRSMLGPHTCACPRDWTGPRVARAFGNRRPTIDRRSNPPSNNPLEQLSSCHPVPPSI